MTEHKSALGKSEAEALLRELFPELPESWDEDSSGCRWETDPNVGRTKDHDPQCIYYRIREFIGWTDEQKQMSDEVHAFWRELEAKRGEPFDVT